MVQYLGVCLPMRGQWFDPWSRKTPHAPGLEASTLEPMLGIKESHHSEKPKHCSCKEPAQPKRGKKKNSKKKVTLNLGDFLNDMWHIYHEIKNQGNIWWWGRGGQWSSLLLNHPHDGVISALWMKDQYLISSPTTNNNLASIHGHTKNDMRKKPCQTGIFYPEKLCFRNEGQIKTFPEKLELREFLTTTPVS